MKNLLFIFLLICVATLIHIQVVQAFMPGPQTDSDFARLPPYCKARLKGPKSDRKYWSKRMWPDFIHMHHYCRGLHLLNKSLGVIDKNEKNSILLKAIQEFKYMQNMSSKDFYLRPEIANKAGNAYLRLGKVPEAFKEFSRGIKLNPKYVLNYVGLSKVCRKQGDITKAKEILQRGLKHNPSSKLLKKRLKRLEK